MKTRLRGDFGISAAEVAHQDLLQRASLGVAAIGPDREGLEPLLEKVSNWVEGFAEDHGAEVVGSRREFLSWGDVGDPGHPFGEPPLPGPEEMS